MKMNGVGVSVTQPADRWVYSDTGNLKLLKQNDIAVKPFQTWEVMV